MDEKKCKKTYTKSRLVKELSWKTQLPQDKVKELLAGLAEIACREARGTFVLPGLCKFEVIRRKARKLRNPRTGEILVLPEHEVLRIVPARAAKMAVAPKVTAVPADQAPAMSESAETAPARPEPVAEAPAEPVPMAEPAQAPVKPAGPVSFRCPQCRQEIEAPGEMAGEEAECPTCGHIVTVPFVSEEGTIHGRTEEVETAAVPAEAEPEVVSAAEAANMYPAAFKSRTIRINAEDLGLDQPKVEESQMVSFRCPQCRQEIEASLDMVGEEAQCPNCGMTMVVPNESESGTLHSDGPAVDPRQLQAMKGRTMRINMPDDF